MKLLDAKEGESGLSKVEIGERAVMRSQIQNLLGRSFVETEIEDALH